MTTYAFYRTVTSLAGPLLHAFTRHRQSLGKEDANRLCERYGVATQARPQGKVMWLHGASVGEALSILPLLNTLQSRLPDWHFLLTTGTVTSAAVMAKRLPDNVIHQFVPWDQPSWVRKFFDHWRPDAVVWLESELWPNMLAEMRQRNIPSCLINARMRPKSQAKWRYAPKLIEQMLQSFTFILTGARDYVPVFRQLGGRNVSYVGSLKFGARPLPVAVDELAKLQAQIGARVCVGFLQTHPTEEKMAAGIYQDLRTICPDLLLIVAPRNNTRGAAIKAELQNLGVDCALRTAGDAITDKTQIYIADTIGEMGLWYSLCPIAVIGGSFIPFGGQNPLEGTHFGTAICYGPSMFNFTELCAALEEARAAIRLDDAAALTAQLHEWLTQGDSLDTVRQASRLLADQNLSVIDAFADEITIQLVPQA